MQFNLTISGGLSELQALVDRITGNNIEISIAPETANSDFPEVPNATGNPKKTRAPKKSKDFIDPGDMDPAPVAIPANAAAANNGVDFDAPVPSAATGTAPVELDDFGDPIAPKPVAPAATAITITLDALRVAMQAKSTVSPDMKAKCQQLVASYNVQTLSMIAEPLWPEVYAKIQAL